jgi:hypothetical protein
MITLVCGNVKMVCTKERAEAIFRIQRKMKVNDWKIDDSNIGTDTKSDRAKASSTRIKQGNRSSK